MFPDLYIHKGKTKITISEKKINKCDLLSLENDAKKKLNSFPSFDYLCDTGEDYDINNLKYFEKIIEKIEAVFAKNQIQVLSKKISTMPVFTKIEFFVNESQVEQVLKLQQILYKVLDIGKFIIMAKDNSIRFEIINVKYGKISFKYLVSNCKNADHLPIGIDIEKNIIFFNTEKNKIITIYGKMGSGTNMAIFSLVLSFCYFNNPLDSTVKIINNSSRDNLHIFDTLSKTVHVNHDCLTDSEEISDYFTNLISTKQIKKTLIVFENFDKYISSSSKNRSSFIEFLKAIKSSSNIYLILTCYEVSVDSAGDDIFNLMENKLVYKLNNETESVSLLKTPIANLLYGNGDGYILDESNVKNRIQTCYIGRNEINNIIDIINTFYLAVNKIN
jgi:DNA segregation ATPase FtsK/SpoIIIE-like protein